MKNIANIDPLTLLDKPIWQMSGLEFCALTQFACASPNAESQTAKQVLCRGVNELADYLGCSPSKIYALRREGVLDGSVVSHIGRMIVFDGLKARELAIAKEKHK